MAEISEQPEPEAVINRPNDDKPKPVPAKAAESAPLPASAPKSKGGFWIAVILLMLMGLAAAGYYLFSQLRDKQEGLGGEVKTELAKQIKDYQSQLSSIQSQISSLQSDIAGKEDRFNKMLSDFSGLHTEKMEMTRKELGEKVLQVQRQLGKTRGDWLIADAEYLLSVANERLHLAGDVSTSRAALEAADQRLRESGDSGTITIREQIAKELSQMQGVKLPDVVGLYASVQALEADVAKLTLALPYSGKPLTPPGETNNSSAVPEEETNSLVTDALHGLEGIVTIKRTDKPVKEILTQEQADFIREQLKVKLEIVKVALVQQNDGLYQATLADVKKWTGEHFNDNDSAKQFLGEVSRLQDVKLRSQLPDISLSLKMLRDVSKLRVETDKAMDNSDEEAAKDGDAPKPASDSKEESDKKDSKPSESGKPEKSDKKSSESDPKRTK